MIQNFLRLGRGLQSGCTIKKSEVSGWYSFLSLGLRPSPFRSWPLSQANLLLKIYF